jgi:ElaB/YqjD/DUF883 family membrane-anchored ribosome-binding protein
LLLPLNKAEKICTPYIKNSNMEKIEKMHMMDKMLRELQDITNSETSLLKKIAQLEAENINLGNSILEKRLPDIHGKVDETLIDVTALQTEFTEARDKFVKDNKLDEVLPEATI